ncbi:MAG: GNAT family N-acetyltransferase, partial [Bacteroidales bacterium]
MENNTHNITVRELGKKDIDILIGYRLDYLTELLGDCNSAQRENTREGLKGYFLEALEQGNIHAVMALEGEKVLSFGAMVIKKIPGDFKKSFYLEGDILNMYTIPGARSRGLSTLVLDHLIDEARKRGICKLS